MRFLPFILAFTFLLYSPAHAQMDVLTAHPDRDGAYGLPQDKGSIGLWHQLLKLQTTASALHTTAHPDDEHAGLLTLLSRGQGVRTALLSINRGEAGANATGAELFDALGLVRTEELQRSGQYYGLDDLYFTRLTDYGYSKTLDEALRSWGKEAVLEDMVRIIRMNRPFVVISRFHGSQRDGHGHHQAVGSITPEAVTAAGDPNRFPEQILEEGLQPWTPFKLYRGGVRQVEPWHVAVDQGEYNPWIGSSYYNFGYYGLSLQRSQTGGRSRNLAGAATLYYERLFTQDTRGEEGFFEGLDTSLSGLYSLFGAVAPGKIKVQLDTIEQAVQDAISAFRMAAPHESLGPLVHGLRTTRQVLQESALHPEVAFLLHIKARQFEEAIHTALGISMTAIALPPEAVISESPWAPVPTLDLVIPGDRFKVLLDVVNPSAIPVTLQSLVLESETGFERYVKQIDQEVLMDNRVASFEIPVKTPDDVAVSRPHFYRASILENTYSIHEGYSFPLPDPTPALVAVFTYQIDGLPVSIHRHVRARRANLPYGYKLERLTVAPRLVVNASPKTRMVPLEGHSSFTVNVEVINNDAEGAEGTVSLKLPSGWHSVPEAHPLSFTMRGQRNTYAFEVVAGELTTRKYMIQVECLADTVRYTEGYQRIERNELDTRFLYKPATIGVQGVDVRIAENLNIAYIMGVGDEVPDGIEQLGATVTLLGEQDLAREDLSSYDVIVVGTRAYAVRNDLINYNDRLLAFAQEGGHLIVLYQTPEYVPEEMAPFPASLPRFAEEVSEQESPVTILRPEHPLFSTPNTITQADFENWVEQRGSKFFATWDEHYIPLVEMRDTGQEPQRGAWLTANYGSGRFTYFALAIHRQVPYAVPGPYRIFANVLSLGIDP